MYFLGCLDKPFVDHSVCFCKPEMLRSCFHSESLYRILFASLYVNYLYQDVRNWVKHCLVYIVSQILQVTHPPPSPGPRYRWRDGSYRHRNVSGLLCRFLSRRPWSRMRTRPWCISMSPLASDLNTTELTSWWGLSISTAELKLWVKNSGKCGSI